MFSWESAAADALLDAAYDASSPDAITTVGSGRIGSLPGSIPGAERRRSERALAGPRTGIRLEMVLSNDALDAGPAGVEGELADPVPGHDTGPDGPVGVAVEEFADARVVPFGQVV